MPSKEKKPEHWGEWIAERSRIVGYKRQRDLAEEIGCTEDRLSRWMQLSKPPERMLKGFDEALARALETSRHAVFLDWKKFAPDEVGIFWEEWMAAQPWDRKEWNDLPADARVRTVTRYLNAEQIELWIKHGTLLIDAAEMRETRAMEIGNASEKKSSKKMAKEVEKLLR